MDINGNLKLIGGGVIANARIENLATDPALPLVGQIWYNTEDGVFKYYDGTEVQIFTSAAQLNDVIAGAGLNADGAYAADETTNYLKTATSLKDADKKLDTALKALSDTVDGIIAGGGASQAEVDAIEAAVGLNTDGTLIAFSGTNYLDTATSIANGLSLLDTQLKLTDTAAAAAASAATTALSEISDVRTTADAALPKAGGAMSGNIAMGDNVITGLAPGVNATDAVNKSQLDGAMAGLDFQPDVWGVQVDATLVPELVEGRRYILTDVAALATEFGTITGVANNDIVEYDGTEFVVAYDVSVAGPGALVWDRGDSTWYYFDTAWRTFGGMSGAEAGIGLEKQGNVFNVLLGAGIGQLPTNEVGVDLLAAGGLFLTVNGTDASTDGAAQLSILLNGNSLLRTAQGLKIADSGVGADQIATAALGNGLVGGDGSVLAVKPKPTGGIIVDADGVSIDPTALPFVKVDGSVAMTGALTLPGAPTQDLQAATKKYVDDATAGIDVTYLFDGSVSAATHTVTHGLGSKYVSVTVIDSSDNVIIPDSIVFVDENSLTVGFTAAMTCKVLVVGKRVPSP